MGYDTRFEGEFKITPALDEKTREIFQHWVDYDPNDVYDASHSDDVYDASHPNRYMQWILYDNETLIFDEESEKFSGYVSWLRYLIKNVFAPNGYKLNGAMRWMGEDILDSGAIQIENNKIIVRGSDRYGDIINDEYPAPTSDSEVDSSSKQKKINLLKKSPEKT